jgi:hypothetical protein
MTAQSPRRVRRAVAVAALAAALLATQAVAESDQPEKAETETCDAADAQKPQAAAQGAVGGMRVSIDPKTGEYTDAPVDAQAPSMRITAAAEAPKPVPLPGGGEMLDTSGFLHAMTATAAPDGQVRTNCAQARQPAVPVD